MLPHRTVRRLDSLGVFKDMTTKPDVCVYSVLNDARVSLAAEHRLVLHHAVCSAQFLRSESPVMSLYLWHQVSPCLDFGIELLSNLYSVVSSAR